MLNPSLFLGPEAIAERAARVVTKRPDDSVTALTTGDPWAGLKQAIREGRVGAVAGGSPAPIFQPLLSDEQALARDEGAEAPGMTFAAMSTRGNRENRPDQHPGIQRPF